ESGRVMNRSVGLYEPVSYIKLGPYSSLQEGAVRPAFPTKITARFVIGEADGVPDSTRFIQGNGARRPANIKLSDDDIAVLTREFEEIGGDPSILKFNQGGQTGYVDGLDEIRVRGDVLPIEGAFHPRSSMSTRAVLAHELGHRAHRGTSVDIGAWNDEFRASYWAAKNSPGLSQQERVDLLLDAMTRAEEAGVKINMNKFMKKTIYGYE
ncbi:hypothetical protein, partial [Hahella sp. HN01]|uniref:hypothetical protein n=1 Tax=Hahella sp. HN01 TaxID=2847262 RepID=UPI001C1EEFB9